MIKGRKNAIPEQRGPLAKDEQMIDIDFASIDFASIAKILNAPAVEEFASELKEDSEYEMQRWLSVLLSFQFADAKREQKRLGIVKAIIEENNLRQITKRRQKRLV